jgi:ABC-type nitrate/sulfonate/bicarbonate transport system substrate-binding protein
VTIGDWMNSASGSVEKGRRVWVAVVIVALVLCAGGYLWLGHIGPFSDRAAAPEKLTIAVAPIPMSAPIYVAADRGYFRQEGLDVSIEPYAVGKDALAAVLSGKADLATVAETPVMFAVMGGGQLFVIATICDSEKDLAIVARKDRGISQPADLKGKMIGVTPGTTADFFLESFFDFHNVPKKSTKTIPLKPAEMLPALSVGRVDAVATWEPVIGNARAELGEKVQTYYATGFYRETWNIVAAPDLVKKRPEVVKKMLRALVSAERFIVEQPVEAREMVASSLRVDKEILAATWSDLYFRIALEQSLLVNLENQARWAIRNKLVAETKVPNFMESLYPVGLKTVHPEAVAIAQ